VSWFKIFSAVVVANVVSWLIVSAIAWLFWIFFFAALAQEFKTATSSLSKPVTTITAPASRPAPKIQAPKPQVRQRGFSNSAIAENKKMCEFWTEQFRKDGLGESEAYRDLACLRYQKSLTTYKD